MYFDIVDGELGEELSDEDTIDYKIVLEGVVIGVFSLSHVCDGLMFFSSFQIYKNFRRRGYGYKVLFNIIKSLKKVGYNKLCLDCDVENLNAISLYTKLGFIGEDQSDGFIEFTYNI